jgi:hypothetical protein
MKNKTVWEKIEILNTKKEFKMNNITLQPHIKYLYYDWIN